MACGVDTQFSVRELASAETLVGSEAGSDKPLETSITTNRPHQCTRKHGGNSSHACGERAMLRNARADTQYVGRRRRACAVRKRRDRAACKVETWHVPGSPWLPTLCSAGRCQARLGRPCTTKGKEDHKPTPSLTMWIIIPRQDRDDSTRNLVS